MHNYHYVSALTTTSDSSTSTRSAADHVQAKAEEHTTAENTSSSLASEAAVASTWSGGSLPPGGSSTGAPSSSISSLGIQTKRLTIGATNDRYEREADRMADTVMSGQKSAPATQASPSSPELQLKEEEQEGAPSIQRKTLGGTVTAQRGATPVASAASRGVHISLLSGGAVQRTATNTAFTHSYIQREPLGNAARGPPAGGSFQQTLTSTKGGGSPISGSTQSFMENRFGTDFSSVRIHTGPTAAGLNNTVQAKAFTHGSDIYFNQGQYNPHSRSGQHLLAHELTHTIQQGAVSSPQPSASDAQGTGMSSRGPPGSTSQLTGTIQRQATDPTSDPLAGMDAEEVEAFGALEAGFAEATGSGGGEGESECINLTEMFVGVLKPDASGDSENDNFFIDLLEFGIDSNPMWWTMRASVWLVEQAFLLLPDSTQHWIMNAMIDSAQFGLTAASLVIGGPLGRYAAVGMSAFLTKIRNLEVGEKYELLKKFWNIVTFQDISFIWNFLKGFVAGFLGDGLIGIIQMFIDIVCLIPTIIEFVGKLISGLSEIPEKISALLESINTLMGSIWEALKKAPDEIWEYIKDPNKIVDLVVAVDEKFTEMATDFGEKAADKLISLMDEPSAIMGFAIGRFIGMIVFEIVLAIVMAVLTAYIGGVGAGAAAGQTAVKGAVRFLTKIMKTVMKMIRPILRFVTTVVTKFKGFIKGILKYLPKGIAKAGKMATKVMDKINELLDELFELFGKKKKKKPTGGGKKKKPNTNDGPDPKKKKKDGTDGDNDPDKKKKKDGDDDDNDSLQLNTKWAAFVAAVQQLKVKHEDDGMTRSELTMKLEAMEINPKYMHEAKRAVKETAVKHDLNEPEWIARARKFKTMDLDNIAHINMSARSRLDKLGEDAKQKTRNLSADNTTENGIEQALDITQLKRRWKIDRIDVEYQSTGHEYHIKGKIGTLTEKVHEIKNPWPRGTYADPIPMRWFGVNSDYPTIQDVQGANVPRTLVQGITLPGRGSGRPITLGVPASNYDMVDEVIQKQVSSGNRSNSAKLTKRLQYSTNGAKPTKGPARFIIREGATTLSRTIAEFGTTGNDYFESDHVRDLGFGGNDVFPNLWPASRTRNNAFNATNQQYVRWFDNGTLHNTQVKSSIGKYFWIADDHRVPITKSAHGSSTQNPINRGRANGGVPTHKVQPKLMTLGKSNDRFEREADNMADHVLSSRAGKAATETQAPTIQRMCSSCENEPVQRKCSSCEASATPCPDCGGHEPIRLTADIVPQVQMKCLSCDRDRAPPVQRACAMCEREQQSGSAPGIQPKADARSGGGQVSTDFSSQLSSSKGGGRAMDGSTRSFMESRFGASFGGVRIHNGRQAASMAGSIKARAFTHGNNIYFNRGQYNPGTSSGKHLLAHELTHTIQQGAAIQRKASDPGNGGGNGEPDGGKDGDKDNESQTSADGGNTEGGSAEGNGKKQPADGGLVIASSREEQLEVAGNNGNVRLAASKVQDTLTIATPDEKLLALDPTNGDLPSQKNGADGAPPTAAGGAPPPASGSANRPPADSTGPPPASDDPPAAAGDQQAAPTDPIAATQAELESAIAASEAGGEKMREEMDKASIMAVSYLDLAKPTGEGEERNKQFWAKQECELIGNGFIQQGSMRVMTMINATTSIAPRLTAAANTAKEIISTAVATQKANINAKVAETTAMAQGNHGGLLSELQQWLDGTRQRLSQGNDAVLQASRDTREAVNKGFSETAESHKQLIDKFYDEKGPKGLTETGKTWGDHAYNAAEKQANIELPSHVAEYSDGWLDGPYTYNKRLARRNAWIEVGKGYQSGFAEDGPKQGQKMKESDSRYKDYELTNETVEAYKEHTEQYFYDVEMNANMTYERALGQAQQLHDKLAKAADTSLAGTVKMLSKLGEEQSTLLNNFKRHRLVSIDRDRVKTSTLLEGQVGGVVAKINKQIQEFFTTMNGRAPPDPKQFRETMWLASMSLDDVTTQVTTGIQAGITAAENGFVANGNHLLQAVTAISSRALAGIGQIGDAFVKVSAKIGESAATQFPLMANAFVEQALKVADSVVVAGPKMVTALADRFKEIAGKMDTGLLKSQATYGEALNKAINGEMRTRGYSEARKAAGKVKPRWKKVLVFIVALIVAIVVAVVLGPIAIGLMTGLAGAVLGAGTAATVIGTILGSAAAGAVAGMASQVTTNALNGDKLTQGLGRAALTGAIGGAFGGAGGLVGQSLFKAAAATSFHWGKFGIELAFDFAGGIVAEVFSGQPFSWTNVLIGTGIGAGIGVGMRSYSIPPKVDAPTGSTTPRVDVDAGSGGGTRTGTPDGGGGGTGNRGQGGDGLGSDPVVDGGAGGNTRVPTGDGGGGTGGGKTPEVGGGGKTPDADGGSGGGKTPDADAGTGGKKPETDDGGGSKKPETDNGGGSKKPETDDGGGSKKPETDDGGGSKKPETDDGGDANTRANEPATPKKSNRLIEAMKNGWKKFQEAQMRRSMAAYRLGQKLGSIGKKTVRGDANAPWIKPKPKSDEVQTWQVRKEFANELGDPTNAKLRDRLDQLDMNLMDPKQRQAAIKDIDAALHKNRAMEAGMPEHLANISAAARREGNPYNAPRQAGERGTGLEDIYSQAAAADPKLKEITSQIATETGGTAGFRPKNADSPDGLKGRGRAKEKIDADYGGDARGIADLAGSKIVFDDIGSLYKALAKLMDNPDVSIVRIKDRFAKPQKSGYRDILMNVEIRHPDIPGGRHIAEMRLHLKAIDEVPEHGLYQQRRTIEDRAKTENRKLTPDEQAKLDGLYKQSRDLFDPVWRDATSPSGRAWNDPNMSAGQFVMDFKAKFPNAQKSNAEIIEIYNSGQRIDPNTGDLTPALPPKNTTDPNTPVRGPDGEPIGKVPAEPEFFLGKRVLETFDTVGNHKYKLLEDGTIVRCSICGPIKDSHAELLRMPEAEPLRKELARIEGMRPGSPEQVKAARKLTNMLRNLDALELLSFGTVTTRPYSDPSITREGAWGDFSGWHRRTKFTEEVDFNARYDQGWRYDPVANRWKKPPTNFAAGSLDPLINKLVMNRFGVPSDMHAPTVRGPKQDGSGGGTTRPPTDVDATFTPAKVKDQFAAELGTPEGAKIGQRLADLEASTMPRDQQLAALREIDGELHRLRGLSQGLPPNLVDISVRARAQSNPYAQHRQRGIEMQTLDDLYLHGNLVRSRLNSITEGAANSTGGSAKTRLITPKTRDGLKGRVSANKKITGDYDGDPLRLIDLAGSAIVFDSVPGLYGALRQIADHPHIKVLRLKDRLVNPAKSHYRDVLMNIEIAHPLLRGQSFIAEMRLHLRPIDAVPEHHHYKFREDIERPAKQQGRALTAEEKVQVNESLAKSHAMYDPVWRDAISPSGKIWNDPSMTVGQFVVDFRARFPNSETPHAKLVEAFNAGKRIDPVSGELVVPPPKATAEDPNTPVRGPDDPATTKKAAEPEFWQGSRVTEVVELIDGHKARILEDGRVIICSICGPVEHRFRHVLNLPEAAGLQAEIARIKGMRNGSPEQVQAVRRLSNTLQALDDIDLGSFGPASKRLWADPQLTGAGSWADFTATGGKSKFNSEAAFTARRGTGWGFDLKTRRWKVLPETGSLGDLGPLIKRMFDTRAQRHVQNKQAAAGNRPQDYKRMNSHSDVDPRYMNDPQRFDDFSRDPAHAGGTREITAKTRIEAATGIEAELSGLVDGPLVRGPEEVEFFDANGTPWDVKTPPSPGPGQRDWSNPARDGNSILKELSVKRLNPNDPPGTFPNQHSGIAEPRRVLLNTTYMNPTHYNAMWTWLNNHLTNAQLRRIVEIRTVP